LASPSISTSGDGEAGFSLVEVMVTIAIISIAFVALVGGMFTSIKAARIHREEAVADTILRDSAELLKDATTSYVPCGSGPAGAYSAVVDPSMRRTVDGINYSAHVTSVECWAGSRSAGAGQFATGSTDRGLERITVEVTSSDGRLPGCAGPSASASCLQVIKRMT
jgi:prepilin-type N-terminal cleavage/methylation domain-containing protein